MSSLLKSKWLFFCLILSASIAVFPAETDSRQQPSPFFGEKNTSGKFISLNTSRFLDRQQSVLENTFENAMFSEFARHRRMEETAEKRHFFPYRRQLPEPFCLNSLKEETSIQNLFLDGCSPVHLDSAILPELKTLTLSGTVSGLDLLDSPKLEFLDAEFLVPVHPNEKKKFTPSFAIKVPPSPTNPGVPKLRLSASKLPSLRRIRLSAVGTADFDYSSLTPLKLESLTIRHFDGGNLNFLKGMSLKELTLSAPMLATDAMDVLTKLPLEKLTLDLQRVDDYSFLEGMKLKELKIQLYQESGFRVSNLKGMPLETLWLCNTGRLSSKDAAVLPALKLKELFLRRTFLPDPAVLHIPTLEALGLEVCSFGKRNVLENIAKNKKLGKLVLWGLSLDADLIHRQEPLTQTLDWKLLQGLPLEMLSFCGPEIDFCAAIKTLKYLRAQPYPYDRIFDFFPLKAVSLKLFVNTSANIRSFQKSGGKAEFFFPDVAAAFKDQIRFELQNVEPVRTIETRTPQGSFRRQSTYFGSRGRAAGTEYPLSPSKNYFARGRYRVGAAFSREQINQMMRTFKRFDKQVGDLFHANPRHKGRSEMFSYFAVWGTIYGNLDRYPETEKMVDAGSIQYVFGLICANRSEEALLAALDLLEKNENHYGALVLTGILSQMDKELFPYLEKAFKANPGRTVNLIDAQADFLFLRIPENSEWDFLDAYLTMLVKNAVLLKKGDVISPMGARRLKAAVKQKFYMPGSSGKLMPGKEMLQKDLQTFRQNLPPDPVPLGVN